MDHDARFDRLEAKLDRLAEAMVKLVEIDTKIDGLLFHNNTQDNRLNKHSEAIDTHAVKLAVVSKSSGANEWFVRLLIACLVTGAALMFRDV
jgi:hypothetical protein|tara:strand:+ start:279 stop:554 length:276 start_codon:yes stop_codon:yes gene_type:complete